MNDKSVLIIEYDGQLFAIPIVLPLVPTNLAIPGSSTIPVPNRIMQRVAGIDKRVFDIKTRVGTVDKNINRVYQRVNGQDKLIWERG